MFNKTIQEDIKNIAEDLGKEYWEKLEGKTILIAGGAGFIGAYFIDTINCLNNSMFSKPCKIICLDNFKTGAPERLSHLKENNNFKLLNHDITKEIKFQEKIDYIIHASSIASPHFYRKYPLETINVNVLGTMNMLNLAKEKNVSGFLYLSSSEIYGDPTEGNIPTKETYRGNVSCTGPRACYDESKRLAETLCMTYFNQFSVPAKIARPFNIYGPGMKIDDKRVIPDFVGSALKDKKIIMFSDGSPKRSFCYITDAVVYFLRALVSEKNGEAFNVGNDEEEVSMLKLAQVINTILSGIEIVKKESPEKDYLTDNPQRRLPDMAKSKKLLGYNPHVDIKTGMKRVIDWYRDVYFT